MHPIFRGLAVAALSMMALACSAGDAPAQFSEGKQYKQVRDVQKPVDPKRVSVEEFFWFGCPHCYAFDPTLSAWAKTVPGDVDFVRVPATLGRPVGVVHAKAFYAAEALNVAEEMHMPLFKALQEGHSMLQTEAQIGQLFNQVTGVLPDVFSSTFNSFAVDSRQRKAEQLAREYGITGVPTVIVGGKYMTSPAMASGFPEATRVIDFLIEKVRQERAGK